MDAKVKGATLLVLAFLGGMALSYIIGSGLGSVPPSSHRTIVDKLTITDLETGDKHYATFVESGNKYMYSWTTLDITFDPDIRYLQSTWIFCSTTGDVNVALTIWGPSEEEAYMLEFSRLASDPFEVKGYGRTTIFPQVSAYEGEVVLGYFLWIISSP